MPLSVLRIQLGAEGPRSVMVAVFLPLVKGKAGDFSQRVRKRRVRPDGVADESAIYLWEHEGIGETCCWRAVASDMAEFITRYYKGVI